MQPALLKLFRAMPNTGIPVQQCAFHLFEDISDVKKKNLYYRDQLMIEFIRLLCSKAVINCQTRLAENQIWTVIQESFFLEVLCCLKCKNLQGKFGIQLKTNLKNDSDVVN